MQETGENRNADQNHTSEESWQDILAILEDPDYAKRPDRTERAGNEHASRSGAGRKKAASGKASRRAGAAAVLWQNPRIRIIGIALIALVLLLCIVLGISRANQAASESAEVSGDGQTEEMLQADSETEEDDAGENSTGESEAGDAGSQDVVTVSPTAPEAEDGSGAAGIMAVPEELMAEAAVTGWHDGNYSKWYALENNCFYYNGWQTIDGSTYHFNSSGYLDLGWKVVGGQGCYFDDNGVYQPDADNSKLVAFTFDDGPSEGVDSMLALCEETGARVTFFMIGVQVENGGAVIPHIMQDRCELGNHSYTHNQQTGKTTEECIEDFAQCDSFIQSFSGGPTSTVVRFPYGDYTAEQTAGVNKPNIFWNIDSLDWDSQDAEQIKQICYEKITEGDIILMHDRVAASVEACRELFPYLISNGYQIVTVSELAAAKGIELQGGVTYYDFCQEDIESGAYCDATR